LASRLPNRLIRLAAFALLFGLLAAGCGDSYGPPVDRSGFVSAMASPDGKHGVFSYHRLVYRPAAGWRAFPDGGIPKYEEDSFAIGVYDMRTGRYRLAESGPNGRWEHGQGEPYVAQVVDGMAIINRGGQLASDGGFLSDHMMLDLDTAELSPLPIEEELAGMGLLPGYYYLADAEGTMAVIAIPAGSQDALKDWRSDESVSKEIWLRHPDGTYEKAADAIHYYGFTGGLVHYYSSDSRRYMVYDTTTGVSAPGEGYPPSQPEKTADLRVHGDNRAGLEVAVKGPDGWKTRDAGINPEGFFR